MGFQWKRFVSMLLVMTLIFSLASVSVNASEAGTEVMEEMERTEEKADELKNGDEVILPDEVLGQDNSTTDNTGEEKSGTEECEIIEEDEQEEDRATLDEEQTVNISEEDAESDEDGLSYVYIESPYLETPNQQNIVFSFEREDLDIRSAVLLVKNETTGDVQELEAVKIQNNLLLFSPVYESGGGIYSLIELNYRVGEDSSDKVIVLEDQELGEVSYGVNKKLNVGYIDQEGQEISEDPELEANIIELDESGSPISGQNLQQEIENASDSLANAAALYANESEISTAEYVVVLDPGHDSTHTGARGNGLNEEELTFKIANYCKEELETYAGVKVFMTRTSSSCPYPGTSSTDDNRARVEYAASIGADLYVSIHLNSSTSASAAGAEVYYPNSNYVSWIGAEGKALASKIQSELAALGLNDRGIKIRDSEDNTLYPDGNLADYYGVIKRSKELGFPGIIVEHAFLTNAGDVSKFLNSDTGLKKLGIADANGIAGYLGLSKEVKVTFDSLKIENIDVAQGTFSAVLSGLKPSNLIKKVQFAVWSDVNGQDDLKTYEVLSDGSGTFQTAVSIADHKYSEGTYFAQAFAIDIYGKNHYLGFASCTMKIPVIGSAKIEVKKNGDGTATLFAEGVNTAKGVRFLVWSDVDGQDDKKYYSAKRSSDGGWAITISLNDFKDYGIYYVHAYVKNAADTEEVKGWTSFTVEKPEAEGINITYLDNEAGSFHAEVKGITCDRGIGQVEIAVCSAGDTSNIYWYTAYLQKNGTYAAAVNISKHQYIYGTYDVHAYVRDKNGDLIYLISTTAALTKPDYKVEAYGNTNQTSYTVTGSNIYCGGEVRAVRFLIWGGTNGQNDMRFYSAVKTDSGSWRATVPISNHKETGTYFIHLYAVLQNGTEKILRTGSFTVDEPTAEGIDVTFLNNNEGSFHAEVKGIQAKAGIQKVSVAACSTGDTSNIYWYTAYLQENKTYAVEVNIINHKMVYGTYDVHAYVTDTNGTMTYLGSTKATLTYPNSSVVKTSGNEEQTIYNIRGEQVYYGGEAKGVKFLVWGGTNGQNDMKFYEASKVTSGTWMANIPISAHKETGKYYIHMYVTLKDGSIKILRTGSFDVETPSAEKITTTYIDEQKGTFHAEVWGIHAPAGVKKISIAACSTGDTGNIYWYEASRQSNGCYAVAVNLKNHMYRSGIYDVHAYVMDGNGTLTHLGMVTCSINYNGDAGNTGKYSIMGVNSVTRTQMVKYYNANAVYPDFYKDTEAATIEDFCRIYAEEAYAENVKVEVAFCQAMKETNFLQYTGDVDIEQYNFAGIGATGNGAKGNSFASPRIGIRAHIQHLKAYASTDELNTTCVDPRFGYVTRGCAPYVEWLGIQENPFGKGWATAAGYGSDIIRRISVLKSY